MIQLSEILDQNDLNGRLERNHDHVHTLANDISANGLTNPVTLRRSDLGYEVIAGRNRVAAYSLLRRNSIPAIVREVSDLATATIRLTENLTRSDLSPVEESIQLAQLTKAHPNGVEGVAATIGRRVSWILDRLEMIEWPEEILAALHAGKLKLGAAAQLAKITDYPHLRFLLEQATTHGVTTATARYWVQQWLGSQSADSFLSEDKGKVQPQTPLTTSIVKCQTCLNPYDIAQTTSIRVCLACSQRITAMANDHTPPTEAPDYQMTDQRLTPP